MTDAPYDPYTDPNVGAQDAELEPGTDPDPEDVMEADDG